MGKILINRYLSREQRNGHHQKLPGWNTFWSDCRPHHLAHGYD